MDSNQDLGVNLLKLILFDLDGTLVITGTDYQKAREEIRSFFLQKGLPESFEFRPVLPKIAEAASQISSDELEQQNLITQAQSYIDKVEKDGLNTSILITGVAETLAYFKQKKIMMGIFSRTSLTAVTDEIRKFELGPFKIIVGRETVPNPKPSPDGLLWVLEKLKLKKDEVWVVGDFIYDIEASVAAGVFSIGVLTGVSNKEELQESGADLILNSVADLRRYFEKTVSTDNRHSGV